MDILYGGAQVPHHPYPLASFFSLALFLPLTIYPYGLGSSRGWVNVTKQIWGVHILICEPRDCEGRKDFVKGSTV